MMIRPEIFFVCRDGDPVEARRIAHIAERLNEMGVIVTPRYIDNQQSNSEGVSRKIIISDQSYNTLLVSTAMIGALGSSLFDIPIVCGIYVQKKMNTSQFLGIQQMHTNRAQQKIKRFSLNPRMVKKRGRCFR